MEIPTEDARIVDNKKIIGPYKVDQIVTPEDLAMLKVAPNELDRAFSEQPGTVAYFGALYGRAKAQTMNFKLARDGVEAQVAQALRDKASQDGEKVVESKIASQVAKVKAYKQVCEAYHDAVAVESAVEGVYLAARARKASLDYFASKKAAEMGAKGFYRGSHHE